MADKLLHPEVAPTVPAEPRRRAPVPVDPALPQLPVRLDPDAMAPFLRRALGPDAPFPDVRIHQVRYAPRTKLLVRYDVGLDGRRFDAVAMIAAHPYLARRAVKPASVALARLVGDRSPARTALQFETELDALIQWYPLDLELPVLAEPPARLVDELEAAGVSLGEVGGGPTTLGYRPRRRAVLRLGGQVLKIYARNEDFAAATVNLSAAAGLRRIRTAKFEGCELLDGYGGRPRGLSWYLAASILRHSRSPFRYLDEHWPERVEGMVAAAETARDR